MADGVNQPTPISPDGAAEDIAARRKRRAQRKTTRAALGADTIKRLSPDGRPPKPAPMSAEAKAEADAAAAAAEAKAPKAKGGADEAQGAQLPAAPRKGEIAKQKKNQVGAPAVDNEAFEAARRAREARMREIRNELRRRRRWRALGMIARLAIFVLIPTAFVGWYYFEKATDMYVSEASMIFKSGSNASTGGGLLGAVMGSSPTDSVALQEYIKSRDILERLDREHGIIAHYKSEDIDWWHRLDADATFDDAFKHYAGSFLWPGKVKVSYDIAEGIVRLQIIAATPEAANRFNAAIISYGEELVNGLNERSRNDGVRMADIQVEKAREDLMAAERKVAGVQEKQNSFSATGEATAIQSEITVLEAEVRAIDGQIAQLRTITTNEDDTRFIPYRTQRGILEEQIAVLRSRLTGGGEMNVGGPSMAQLSSELRLAETDVLAANMMYQSALTARESALQFAAEQSLFLEVVTQPTTPTKATRPKRLQNTGLVFLILFASYIIGLLTFSLIREQAAI
ncbi:MAG: hypothetical protein AAFN79_05820 [Pseudomonadota bacterium]